jgi:hypothetical protein
MRGELFISRYCWSFLTALFLAMVSTDVYAQDMSFRTVDVPALRDCRIIAEGQIASDTPNRFNAEFPEKRCGYVVLRSAGGNLAAGVRLGRIFRAQGVETVVDSRCESACAYAFLGGASRSFSEFELDDGEGVNITTGRRDSNRILGFHRFYSSDRNISADDAQLLAAELVRYIVEMGVDARLFTSASQSGANEMFFPTEEELRRYDVVTQGEYGGFFLEPYRNGVIAASRFEGVRFGRPARIEQLTAFCRGGRAEILLTLPVMAGTPVSSGYDAVPFMFGPQGEGSGWQGWHEITATVRRSGDVDLIAARLSPREAQVILGVEYLEIWLDIARAFGNISFDRPLTEIDRAMLRAAFRHCID